MLASCVGEVFTSQYLFKKHVPVYLLILGESGWWYRMYNLSSRLLSPSILLHRLSMAWGDKATTLLKRRRL